MAERQPDEVVLRSLGGEVTMGGDLIVCRLSGGIVDGLLWLAAGLCLAGTAAVVAVGWSQGFPLLFAAGGPILFGLYFGALLRLRRRRMGLVTVSLREQHLTRSRGGKVLERWRLDQVRFGAAWDPFHRDFGVFDWLVARVPDGRRLRLAKARRGEVQEVLRRFKGLGLGLE